MRIRVPSAKGNPQALEDIRRNLASVVGVSTVEVNESIGTLTIFYDPKQHLDFERHLANEQSQDHVSLESSRAPEFAAPKLGDLSHIDELISKEAEFLAGHSHAAQSVMDFVNRLDREVKRATGNAVDLKVIAPLALAAGVFLELGVAASTPVWLTLSLFSFNHFVDLHSHPQNGDPSKPAPPRRKRFP